MTTQTAPTVATAGTAPISFWGAVASVLGKYADFSTRASRREFWFFAIFATVIQVVLSTILLVLTVWAFTASALDGRGTPPTITNPTGFIVFVVYATVFGLWSLYLIMPVLSVHVRRFHDAGYTGWLLLLVAIPSVGSIVVFVFMALPSAADNQWGPASPR
ncbi:MAG TPA: DUF805 domain-containing protein [Microbacteriaceae bacterium]|nr:DUF805 domain-containing protein [Microbacteriaceae bacterium]